MKIPVIPGFQPDAFIKYFKNTGYLMTGKVGSLVIRMLVDIVVINYLGKDQNGIINYASAFVVLFFAIAGLGLDQFIVRELVKNPKRQNIILGTSVALKLMAAIAIIPIIALCYPLYANDNTPQSYLYILSLIGIFQAFNVMDSYYQSQVQGKKIMFVNITGNVISAIIKLTFIGLQLSLQWFVWALVIDSALIAFGYISLYYVKTKGKFNWKFENTLAKSLLEKSWPLMFSAVLVTIYMKIDQLMIGKMLNEGELGIYSTVVKLSEAWYFVPVAIVSSVFPAIINAKNKDEAHYQKRMQDLYDLMVVIGLTVAIGVTIFDDFIYQLLYKPEFQAGAPILSMHIWGGLFGSLGVASGQYLINEGYFKLSLVRTAAGALVNIILNIILLPIMGIMGAALATLIAYFTATFFLIFVPDTRKQALMMFKSLFLISLFQKIVKR